MIDLSKNNLFQKEIRQWSNDISKIKDKELQSYLTILLEDVKKHVYKINQAHQDLVNGQNSFNSESDIRRSLFKIRQKIKKHIIEARELNLL